MTNTGVDGVIRRQTLSRSTAHLENLANILSFLQGGATLLHELTQNANDAGASQVAFTATDDELTVWNDSTFSDCGTQEESEVCPWKGTKGRSCDLHSFRNIGGRHKDGDEKTTGAFGVGFTAVYQVTDHPELITNGIHWILDESKPEAERITVCSAGCDRNHGANGTTFHLPWASSDTELRNRFSSAPLKDSDIRELLQDMHGAAPYSLVFLESLKQLEVDGGGTKSFVRRSSPGDRIVITVNDEPTSYLALDGEAPGADALKSQHEAKHANRSPKVQIAIPIASETIGLVFADLPTETRTGWHGHINGTFFPMPDRKNVEFEAQGFPGKWNDLLIEAAAGIVATNIESIGEACGHEVAWQYLLDAELINRAIEKDRQYPRVFAAFFDHAKRSATDARIALLASGRVTKTADVVVPGSENHYDAVDALTKLDLDVLHPSIRPLAQQMSMTQYGMHILTVSDVIGALERADLTDGWTPGPDSLLLGEDVEALLILLESLQQRGKKLLEDGGADTVAIVPCLDGSYASAKCVARLRDNDRALFELLDPELKVLDEARLNALCPALVDLCDDITPERALEIFEADVDALAAAPDEVLEWLANHPSAVTQPDLRDRVSALPVFPSASGEYRRLTELSLPSDFEDVLEVADVVHPAKASGYTDLLRRLGAMELDAAEYLIRHVGKVAALGLLDSEKAIAVLRLIDRHRAELARVRDDLQRLRLVPCDDGLVRPAADVHLPNGALALIAPDAPVADVDQLGEYLRDTLIWLGVSQHPSDEILNDAARRLGQPDTQPNLEVAAAILNALPNPPVHESMPSALSQLRSAAWLPCKGGRRGSPGEVYAIFQEHLFKSQGLHLALAREDQQRLVKVLDWLGVQTSPTTDMIIAHLHHCSANNLEIHTDVYRALGQAKEEHLVAALRDRECIQIAPGKFVTPGSVFWSNPGLGSWAHVLSEGAIAYREFYDRVGVTHMPTPEQVEQILRALSREAGSDRLPEADKSVVHRCWEMLDELADSAGAVFDRLGVLRSAIGPRDLLEKPTLLLFADGRRLAEAVPLIRDNLIRRDKTTSRALEAAGVRRAEEVITPHVDQDLAYKPAKSLPIILAERRPALERLSEAQRNEGVAVDVSCLDDIHIDEMPELAVEYVTRFAHQVHVDAPRPAEAIYFAADHRLIVRSDSPSRHVARELSLCIAPDADTSSLAPAITEVLVAANLADAMRALDDYGVRDLDPTVWDPIASETVVEPSQGESDQTIDVGVEIEVGSASVRDTRKPSPDGSPEDDDPPSESTSASGNVTSGESEPKHRVRQPSGQRRTQMVSFVSYDDTPGDDEAGDAAPKRSAIDAAGVAMVVAYERSCGRKPEEQPHNNPGFDVLSRNKDGNVVRRIEIKSIGGVWTDFGVWMSATQMEDNRASGDDYWLYVVEHASDPDAATLHRIQNPAGQATKFGFDPGWQAIREPDLERDESGTALVTNTRRLLGWD